MELLTYAADILKYTLSGGIVVLLTWLLIRSRLDGVTYQYVREYRKLALGTTLPLRLQAYERAILFLERINPTNMLVRLHSPEMTALQMQQVILSEIRAEFQHNVTQQLYISDQSWSIVKTLMNDTIAMVNTAVNALPPDASALILSKAILTHLENLQIENPYHAALTMIKRDIQNLF